MERSEREKRNREYLKKRSRCIECQKIDAYTLNKHPKCAVCMARDAEYHRIMQMKDPARFADQQRGIREKRKLEHRCTRCGGDLPSIYNFKTCIKCRLETANYQRNKRAQMETPHLRGEKGFCWTCNKEKAVEGKRLCKKCMERVMKNLIAGGKDER